MSENIAEWREAVANHDTELGLEEWIAAKEQAEYEAWRHGGKSIINREVWVCTAHEDLVVYDGSAASTDENREAFLGICPRCGESALDSDHIYPMRLARWED